MESNKNIPVDSPTSWLAQIPSRFIPALILTPLSIAAIALNYEQLDFWFFVKMTIAVVVLSKIIKWLNIDGKGPGCGCNESCSK